MVKRHLHGVVTVAVGLGLTGCHIPANLAPLGAGPDPSGRHAAYERPPAGRNAPSSRPGCRRPRPRHHHARVLRGGALNPTASTSPAMASPTAPWPMAWGDMAAACPPGIGDGGAGMGGGGGMTGPTSQIGFIGPDGMQVRWDVSTSGGFDSSPLVTPGRYDFAQARSTASSSPTSPATREWSSIPRSRSRR